MLPERREASPGELAHFSALCKEVVIEEKVEQKREFTHHWVVSGREKGVKVDQTLSLEDPEEGSQTCLVFDWKIYRGGEETPVSAGVFRLALEEEGLITLVKQLFEEGLRLEHDHLANGHPDLDLFKRLLDKEMSGLGRPGGILKQEGSWISFGAAKSWAVTAGARGSDFLD